MHKPYKYATQEYNYRYMRTKKNYTKISGIIINKTNYWHLYKANSAGEVVSPWSTWIWTVLKVCFQMSRVNLHQSRVCS